MTYPTPQDAERAFYKAFESSDIETMMSVWADTEDIECIHPLGGRLRGRGAVRDSWEQIFRSAVQLSFHVTDQWHTQGPLLSVHVVHENIRIDKDSGYQPPIVATNVYQLTRDGWRMILHHASPLRVDGEDEERPPETVVH